MLYDNIFFIYKVPPLRSPELSPVAGAPPPRRTASGVPSRSCRYSSLSRDKLLRPIGRLVGGTPGLCRTGGGSQVRELPPSEPVSVCGHCKLQMMTLTGASSRSQLGSRPGPVELPAETVQPSPSAFTVQSARLKRVHPAVLLQNVGETYLLVQYVSAPICFKWCTRSRHERWTRKWIPRSDPNELDPRSVWIIDPTSIFLPTDLLVP